MTYAGTILVDIQYMRGRNIIQKKNIEIGKMPIMLRYLFPAYEDLQSVSCQIRLPMRWLPWENVHWILAVIL
jgi:DNA-directed RNA polymerase beta subunit